MNEFFNRLSPKAPPHQPINANQGLRMMHAPPILPNSKGKKAPPPPILNDAPLRIHMPNRSNSQSRGQSQLSEEELTVTNLRKLYSSLLEEMAPLHQQMGTDANFRWKNSGTMAVNGTDDEGFDYSYTPDNSKKSWRLQRGQPGVAASGGNGITGGDWSKDGIRRYYTGGALERGGGGRSSNIMRVGGIDVDVGTMNGVALSPRRKVKDDGAADGEELMLDHNFSIDDDDNSLIDIDGENYGCENDNDKSNELPDANEDCGQEDSVVDVCLAASGSSMEDVALETASASDDTNPLPSSTQSNTNGMTASSNNNSNNNNVSFSTFNNNTNMTTFESMYHLTPVMAWRLRSAYSPKTTQEQHLIALGSEILAQRHPEKADGIMKGLEVARNCETKVCDGLRRIGELISYCERLKGTKFAVKKETFRDDAGYEHELSSEEEDDDDIESADAMFAYFCEKNVLPMLIDSLLCHPPPLTSSPQEGHTSDNMVLPTNTTTIGSAPSPFSGVAWTAAVKAQILQTIAMILFNTSSPLSLTYLLSNNYMNELIMGMLPLDQWKDDAVEEILPPYITLLRGLVMRLRGDEGKCCLPLFLCQRQRRGTKPAQDDNSTETYLPLLYAAVQVFCSPFGSSLRDSEGCFIRTTAMNVILNLCRITDPEVRLVLVQGGDVVDESLPSTKSVPSTAPPSLLLSHPLTIEQELLFPHICSSLNSWFHRSVRLAMAALAIDDSKSKHDEAKVEAKARHKDIAERQFRELQYWLGFLDDILSCEIRAWNARLVEWFLREVVVGTVLLRWNRSLDVIERNNNDSRTKASSEVYKARAEARVAIVFLTQLFGMVEYSPLIRLVGAVVLHHKYPRQFCDPKNSDGSSGVIALSNGDSFFVVTPIINAMVSRKYDATEGARSGEEADAGAGGGTSAAPDSVDSIQESSGGENDSPGKKTPSSDGINEMDHRALETVAAKHNFHQLAEDVEQNYDEQSNNLIPNRHRAALLAMLAGNTYSSDETILASMLLATILENNDALDNQALEIFGVLPSPTDSIQLSPFESSIAKYLTQDWSDADNVYARSYSTLECVSSLGLMLLERIIYHTWTEGGQCVDVVPFDHYYNSSKLVQSFGASLSHFASKAQSFLPETNTLRELFPDLIKQRYSCANDRELDSPGPHEEPVRLVCSLSDLYPSNFIDNAGVLTCVSYDSGCKTQQQSSSTGDLFLFSNENEAAKFTIQSLLHLRSIVGCTQDLYQRCTSLNGPRSIANSRWYGEGEFLSFCTKEEADDILLTIGGIQTTRLPEVGTDLDLRERTFFSCSLPRKSKKFGRKANLDPVIDANGVQMVVTEKTKLVLVVDLSEIYVAQGKVEDSNMYTVLAVIPFSKLIASATEGTELLHIVCLAQEKQGQQDCLLKNGTLTLRFDHSETTKDCLDKHCSAYEIQACLDMADMLEKCLLMGADNFLKPTSQSNEEDTWCDFQQA